jgi:hypothetical protein
MQPDPLTGLSWRLRSDRNPKTGPRGKPLLPPDDRCRGSSNERFVLNSSTSCLPIFATLIMPYRALYRLIEKPPRSSRRRLFIFIRGARLSVSFQITILKVLAGQAEGRAALPELTRQVSILISSGHDWTERTKRLAALAPGLNIFQSGFVFVDRANWQITDAGRAFLISLETSTSADNSSAIPENVISPDATPPAYNDEPKLEVTASLPPSRLMRLIKRRRSLRPDRMRRSS